LALAGAAGAAAAAALVAWPQVFRSRPDAVVAGDVILAPPAAGESRGDATFRSAGGGRVRLAEAEVDLGRTTEIAWSRGLRRVELRRGGVTVDVEHRPGQHFEVRTPRFSVVVVGTRFSVDLGGVRTERGIVQVVRPDGSIAARVEAGQTWRADPTAAAAPAAPAPATVPAPTPALATTPAPAASAAPAERPAAGAVARLPDSTGRLGEARRALARGDAGAARRLVSPLFRLGREVGVEARILFAESFLIEGRYADAMEGYRVVVRDFPGTSQAENAQFALAQLASEHGRGDEARAAFEAYLARYPRGRFAREAALRLAQPSLRAR
jgi:TolA-binding protein